MPNALWTHWVTLEVNDVPLSLCNYLGWPNLRMISWSSFLPPPQPSQASVGDTYSHPVNVSIMTNRYLYT